ncbi:MAG: phosphoribosylformylglycinamidine synthase, partial [Oscillospiraceae bacterium]|nr:phosphoribosylformylglycinamidine synthase [Oscillospiraceae bacterium]
MVYRIFVEKKQPHNIKAEKLLGELKIYLGQRGLKNIRIITRFDVEGVDEDDFKRAVFTIFADPAVDNVTGELPEAYQDSAVFAIELLPGQYDQYADIAALGLQIFTGGEKPKVRCAEIYILEGECEPQKIKDYLINKVESKEAPLDAFDSLEQEYAAPGPVAVLENFNELNEEELAEFLVEYSLAMDLDDILFCQNYFKNTENRAPTITEIKMLDAYWSDHCRHTTFNTEITDVEIWEPCVKDAFEDYLNLRGEVYSAKNKKPVTLMDIATIGAKYLKKQGLLGGLDESEEVNACSVNIKADIDGKEEDYLLMFKNETHNHPTEIEPFGGASTCLGGAVRDPLSGRSYVYQAMRVTGAADPRNTETLKNKLPQHKITRTAADGYSSYGNQAGVAAGGIYEIYHPGYTAKRMELGAVIGAAPKNNVRRAVPAAGDAVILVGGRTGRDGIGGAAGSSKSHTRESLSTSGAEVQKGDAFGGRKLQRLFKKPHVARMIKRCNDFGAGGVSVAVGE